MMMILWWLQNTHGERLAVLWSSFFHTAVEQGLTTRFEPATGSDEGGKTELFPPP